MTIVAMRKHIDFGNRQHKARYSKHTPAMTIKVHEKTYKNIGNHSKANVVNKKNCLLGISKAFTIFIFIVTII
jgi:hypothetical protein